MFESPQMRQSEGGALKTFWEFATGGGGIYVWRWDNLKSVGGDGITPVDFCCLVHKLTSSEDLFFLTLNCGMVCFTGKRTHLTSHVHKFSISLNHRFFNKHKSYLISKTLDLFLRFINHFGNFCYNSLVQEFAFGWNGSSF